MRDIRNELSEIDYQRKIFDKFVVRANSIILKLHEKFNLPEINLPTSEIKENSFEFTFLGLDFIIKAEIVFNSEIHSFKLGELNTYYRSGDSNELILTYTFDSIGNITSKFLTEEFYSVYYVDMFRLIVEYSKNRNVKFQFK